MTGDVVGAWALRDPAGLMAMHGIRHCSACRQAAGKQQDVRDAAVPTGPPSTSPQFRGTAQATPEATSSVRDKEVA